MQNPRDRVADSAIRRRRHGVDPVEVLASDLASNPDETLADKQQTRAQPPCGALMFSCIGRSPFFYGGEDRDLKVFTERFPDLPLIGVYGTGQIAPLGDRPGAGNGEFQNAVVIALITPQEE